MRFSPQAPEAEAYLRKALEIDPKNGKAAFHLIRLLRRTERWSELVMLLEQRSEAAATNEEKISALLGLASLARSRNDAASAEAVVRRVLQLDPAQPQALRTVTDAYAAAGDWPSLVAAYQAAVKAKRDDDLGMVLQIAMVLWKHLGDLDQAEEYFRRVRKRGRSDSRSRSSPRRRTIPRKRSKPGSSTCARTRARTMRVSRLRGSTARPRSGTRCST